LERKNPFGPEEKTAPSVRNPVLEGKPERAAVAVEEIPPRPADASQMRPRADVKRAESVTLRPTDDAVGPSTPRPGLSLETVPRVLADAEFIRALPLEPRDAFLLAHLDGANDIRTLVDITGMTRFEVSMIVEKLIDLGVVELG
jgi:hypothetical protein